MEQSENKNKLIKHPYNITRARHNYNVHEMRILIRIIESLQSYMEYSKDRSDVQKTLLGDTIVNLNTQSLLPLNSENYSCVKLALKSLENKIITVNGKDSKGEYTTNARLIMKSKYYCNNQLVEIQLDRDLVPDLLALSKNYSQYLVEVAFNSSSTYVMKLYLHICHWKDKIKKSESIDSIRNLLDLGTKYAKPKDIRRRILEPASKELKERADVWFEIDSTVKQGRSITGYVLSIYSRKDSSYPTNAHTHNIKNILIELFGLSNYHLKQLEPIISKQELQAHIYDKIQEITQQIRKGKVTHIKPYVVKALKNEFGDPGNNHEEDNSISQEELELVRKQLQGDH
jgi:plasmid replication initiation protein